MNFFPTNGICVLTAIQDKALARASPILDDLAYLKACCNSMPLTPSINLVVVLKVSGCPGKGEIY